MHVNSCTTHDLSSCLLQLTVTELVMLRLPKMAKNSLRHLPHTGDSFKFLESFTSLKSVVVRYRSCEVSKPSWVSNPWVLKWKSSVVLKSWAVSSVGCVLNMSCSVSRYCTASVSCVVGRLHIIRRVSALSKFATKIVLSKNLLPLLSNNKLNITATAQGWSCHTQYRALSWVLAAANVDNVRASRTPRLDSIEAVNDVSAWSSDTSSWCMNLAKTHSFAASFFLGCGQNCAQRARRVGMLSIVRANISGKSSSR